MTDSQTQKYKQIQNLQRTERLYRSLPRPARKPSHLFFFATNPKMPYFNGNMAKLIILSWPDMPV